MSNSSKRFGIIPAVSEKRYPFPFHDGFFPVDHRTLMHKNLEKLKEKGCEVVYCIVEYETDNYFKDYYRHLAGYMNMAIFYLDYHENHRMFCTDPLWQSLWAINTVYNTNNKISRSMIADSYVITDFFEDAYNFLVVDEGEARVFYKENLREFKRKALTSLKGEGITEFNWERLLADLKQTGGVL